MPDFTTTSGRNVDSFTSSSSTNDPAMGRSFSIDDYRYSISGEQIMPATFDFASLQTAETKQVAADFAAYQ